MIRDKNSSKRSENSSKTFYSHRSMSYLVQCVTLVALCSHYISICILPHSPRSSTISIPHWKYSVPYWIVPVVHEESSQPLLAHKLTLPYLMMRIVLGAFLTAMTFHSIRVELYMTKISFLSAFFSVCVRCLLKRNLNIVCAVFKRI